MATARLLCYSEQVLRADGPLWALRLDFSKLYNMVSPVVAAKLAVMMGLEPSAAERLIRPMINAVGYWRLPMNAVCPPFRLGRGIPQGLSASVLLGEVFICALVWKLHWAGVVTIAYVDDIHLLATQRHVFLRGLQLLEEFVQAFALHLNVLKSALLGLA